MRDLEQGTPLLGGQPPMPPRAVQLGAPAAEIPSREDFPPRLGIVGHDSAHFAQIRPVCRAPAYYSISRPAEVATTLPLPDRNLRIGEKGQIAGVRIGRSRGAQPRSHRYSLNGIWQSCFGGN